MFLFSTKLKLPVYYRILPGNIREVKAFKLTLEESGLTDAVIISDKGFFSQANVDCLETERLNYIIPLRRNSTLINYEPIEQPRKTGFDHYFCYHNRFIWHYTIDYPRRKVVVFFDEQLKVREISDYLKRIETHPESYQLANFKEKESSLGTLAVLNNLQEKTPEAIYHYYKSRDNIEIMFDAMKNILEADASYMQNELALQGWMFINHIALQWYYQIYQLLTQKGLGSKYSVIDILSHLAEIRKVKINGNWKTAEINAKTVAVLEKLGIPIT
jgi:transposase